MLAARRSVEEDHLEGQLTIIAGRGFRSSWVSSSSAAETLESRRSPSSSDADPKSAGTRA